MDSNKHVEKLDLSDT